MSFNLVLTKKNIVTLKGQSEECLYRKAKSFRHYVTIVTTERRGLMKIQQRAVSLFEYEFSSNCNTSDSVYDTDHTDINLTKGCHGTQHNAISMSTAEHKESCLCAPVKQDSQTKIFKSLLLRKCIFINSLVIKLSSTTFADAKQPGSTRCNFVDVFINALRLLHNVCGR